MNLVGVECLDRMFEFSPMCANEPQGILSRVLLYYLFIEGQMGALLLVVVLQDHG